jgi:hypothetical protein
MACENGRPMIQPAVADSTNEDFVWGFRVAYASIDISEMEELYGKIVQAAEDLLHEKS